MCPLVNFTLIRIEYDQEYRARVAHMYMSSKLKGIVEAERAAESRAQCIFLSLVPGSIY